jgi:glyoxylase-like metal-dependent hydrolase (beta-lactamase superfamily II)
MKLQDGVYWYREKGVLDANTYVIMGEQTVLIDPGLGNYLGLLLKEMQEDGIAPKEVDVIAITHLHPDHCDATAALKAVSGAKVAVHSLQWEYRDLLLEEASRVLGIETKKFEVDFVFEDRFTREHLLLRCG